MLRRFDRDPFFIHDETLREVVAHVLTTDQPNARRGAWGMGLLAAHRLVAKAVQAGRWLDDTLFPGYRTRRVESPVFIVANPRSGTTFLHRLMSLDEQFFHLKLYHTLFPSVSLIRLFHSLDELEGPVGDALRAVTRLVERLAFGGWDDIHRIGFRRAEEDEALFVLNLLTPALYLLLHEIDDVPTPGYLDTAPREVRDRIIRYYRDSITRIAEAEQADGRLLEKSVLIGGRIQTMLEVYPDARFVHLVRHPYRAIPSFVSMFRSTWHAVSPSIPDESPETRRLTELGIDYYRRLHDVASELDDERVRTVMFGDLVGKPVETLEGIYDWLDTPMTDAFRASVEYELAHPAKHKSNHEYSLEQFGISRDFICEQLADVFEEYGFEK
ncbi:MAG: sulfotransferase [Myxococcota bacterium]